MAKSTQRIVSGALTAEEARVEASVRPKRLADFIGQSRVKELLSITIEAAKNRGEALDHVLLYGPPGLGKTTLAQILANEMSVSIKTSSGPLLERKGDLTAVLTALESGEMLFLDEIHRLFPEIEEILYPAMEDFQIDLVIGQGPGARIHPYRLNRFTLIGATTRAGLLTAPLRSRFGIVHRLDFYTPEEVLQIVLRSAKILEIGIDEAGAREVARRSRGTPRVANRLLRRVRDYAEVRCGGVLSAAAAHAALELLEVDERGLDRLDREILRAICERFGGGPVGLSTLAVAVGEERDTIEDVYEPHLLREGLLKRTPRGRAATPAAFAHLGLKPPAGAAADAEGALF